MIDTRWHDHQVVPLQQNPDPIVLLSPHVKVTTPIDDVTNLLILVQVFVEEHLELVLVGLAHFLGRDGDLVTVLVASFLGELVYILAVGEVVVKDAEPGEIAWQDFSARVV